MGGSATGAAKDALPTGTVTFLFTDIEGSTRLLGYLQERYPALLDDHHRILRQTLGAAGGIDVGTEGDSFFCVFANASDALRGVVDAQRALEAHGWPEGASVRVRMGLHTGEGVLGGDNYTGIDVHRASRISAAGHGGQVLLSEATCGLVARALPDGVTLRDLGEHRLKDLEDPERLFQVVADGLQADFPPVRSMDVRAGNLPTLLTSFIGREREIEDVKDLLRRTRVLTLTGPGGTGKTRLSLEVASQVQGEYADGAYFVPLGAINEPDLVVPAIRHALGLREEPSRRSLDTVTEFLSDKEMLLVLDNFEQVVSAAPDIGEILAAAGRLKVLTSSRESLRLHGEAEYPVPPLALPDVSSVPAPEALARYESVALFLERAAAVKPSFSITEENARAVAEICARLDGLPLAIELAAARVKVLSPEAIIKRLQDRLSLLAGGARDLPARQQTLRGAIGWSYELLSEEEQRLFARVAVFFGGFRIEAAEAICGPGIDLDPFEGVASLVAKSLLRQVEDGGDARFFLLHTIWEYAKERLDEMPDADEVHARHAGFFLDLAEGAAPQLMGPRQAEMLDTLADEHENLRRAIAWAVKCGEAETALRLGAALWRFWQMRGHLREAAERLPVILEVPGIEAHPEAHAAALEAAGGVFYWMSDWEPAERYYTECLELRRRLGDKAAIGEALYNLAFAFVIPPPPKQDVRRAEEKYEEALEIFRELDDRHGVAKVLWGIANAQIVQRNWQASYDAAAESLELFRQLEDRFNEGWALYTMGMNALFLARIEEAEGLLREGLELFAAADDVSGIALLLNGFAISNGLLWDLERASRLWGASEAVEARAGVGLVSNWESWIPWDPDLLPRELGTEEFERLRAEGAAMSIDEAVAYALKSD